MSKLFYPKLDVYGFESHGGCQSDWSLEGGRLRTFPLDLWEDIPFSTRDKGNKQIFWPLKSFQFSLTGFSNENIIHEQCSHFLSSFPVLSYFMSFA